MAVRKIGINNRSITGRHGYSGQQFESTLERDLQDIVAFDYNVDRCIAQPVKIAYYDQTGRQHTYTPDLLIVYRRDIVPALEMPHMLVEVKYRDEYRGRFAELKARFRAARAYAKRRGWRFVVLTEREIRTPYLENARFLLPFRECRCPSERALLILDQVSTLGETSPEALIESLADSEFWRGTYLRDVWNLIARMRIGADLTIPLTMHSRIWHVG